MPITEDDLRAHLSARGNVHVQIARQGDGSPEIAWGDSFIYTRGADGSPRKMPFATIVIKDYPGFDTESKLERGGLFRLNLDVGTEKFRELFGFAPRELEQHRASFDFSAVDVLFPHPAYGGQGWVSVISPSDRSRALVTSLMDHAFGRAGSRS